MVTQRLKVGNNTATTIASACHTIEALWEPAQLIALKLANPHRDTNSGTHSASAPATPISLSETEQLDDIASWLTIAATACGMTYADAINSKPEKLAGYTAQKAEYLATLVDAAEWQRDATQSAATIKQICDISKPVQKWRGIKVRWEPTQIATLLTNLTGKPISASRLRRAHADGRILTEKGQVTLGDVAHIIK